MEFSMLCSEPLSCHALNLTASCIPRVCRSRRALCPTSSSQHLKSASLSRLYSRRSPKVGIPALIVLNPVSNSSVFTINTTRSVRAQDPKKVQGSNSLKVRRTAGGGVRWRPLILQGTSPPPQFSEPPKRRRMKISPT